MARRWPRQSRGPPEKGMNVGAGLAAPASRAAPAAVHLGAAESRTSAYKANPLTFTTALELMCDGRILGNWYSLVGS